VELPKFYNPVTNLLAPHAVVVRQPKQRGRRKAGEGESEGGVPAAAAAAALDAGAAADAAAAGGARGEAGTAAAGGFLAALAAPQGAAAATAAAQTPGSNAFIPAAAFGGKLPGYVFKLDGQGLGYYADMPAGTGAAAAAAAGTAWGPSGAVPAPSSEVAARSGVGGPSSDPGGWLAMRSVADLRRALGVGAPRLTDSLYKPIERAPRRFNPLKVPASLQVGGWVGGWGGGWGVGECMGGW
jgi:ribosome biogenesis protein BMS1